MKYKPYSYSKISTYLQCPRKFKFSIEQPIKAEGYHLSKGSLFHEYLESKLLNKSFNKSVLNYTHLTSDQFYEILDTANIFIKSNFFNLVYNKKTYLIEEWCNFDQRINPIKGPGLLNGKIDYFYQNGKIGMIVDWKTGGKSKENLETWPKDTLQLEIYALWALVKYKLDKVYSIFSFVEHNYQQSSEYLQKDIPIIRNKILSILNKIEIDEEFLCNIGPLCGWCDYKESCPEFIN